MQSSSAFSVLRVTGLVNPNVLLEFIVYISNYLDMRILINIPKISHINIYCNYKQETTNAIYSPHN